MEDTAPILLVLLIYGMPVWLLIVTLITGKIFEKQHYKSIHARERAFLAQPAITLETVPHDQAIAKSDLAAGSVVISVDHFKKFLGGFRTIFGGEMRSYSSVIDRGRREAVLRMKESQPRADMYLNTRLETATIKNNKGKPMGAVEIVAYSTAVHYAK